MGSPFKMNPKTPFMKALVGKQGNLPQQLQDAIKAAPESPVQKTTDPKKKKPLTDAEIEAGMWKGSTEVVGTPYEGRAWVGTTGTGSRQPVGKTVVGRSTERAGLSNEKHAYVAGEVQPRSVVGSSQDSIIKGSATEIKRATRPSKEKEKAKGKSPAKLTDKYGKKHSRLREKSQKLEDKAMNYPGEPKVSDKKANKLLDKSEKAKNKAKAIRNNSPAKSYGKSPAKMIGNYKMTSIKQKVKRNAKK